MAGKFESAAWHAAIADAIRADGEAALTAALVRAVSLVVNHEGTCLIAFHSDARPEVLHHTLEPAGRKHYLERYLAGPYLLDPLYQLAMRGAKPSLCRFRDELPDRFRSSEYYHQYCERTHLLDEMDFLAAVSEETTLVMVVGRRARMFTRAELRSLEIIEPAVQACLQRIWSMHHGHGQRKTVDEVHRRLTECFDGFGQSLLTRRESEISQLLLRGHSTKSVAQELKIAPGTVIVHKRNLFSKLGISSQYELFSLFIDELSA